MRVLHLRGTPRAMGEAHGESLRSEIQEFYNLRVLNALAQAKQFGGRQLDQGHLLAVADKSLAVSESYDPEGFAELGGIARAAHLTVAQVFAMNGLTDLRDVLAWSSEVPGFEGCSSFLVQGDRTKDAHLLGGQTWDLATDNMPYVIGVHRQPKDGPETWSLTTSGCLSLIGLNGEGLAVGTTNIRTKDARPGICYLSVIHRALRQRTLDEAIGCVTTKHRAAAHYYWLASGREGRAAGIECTATQHHTTELARGHFVHCNHVLSEENRPLEAAPPKPSESTVCRQSRMGELIEGATQGIEVGTMRGFLSDHQGGEGAICRHDLAGISSNGAAIIDPVALKMWACQGLPCTATWIELTAA
jgi:isopenicillin-N N-acyltransferase-like protein